MASKGHRVSKQEGVFQGRKERRWDVGVGTMEENKPTSLLSGVRRTVTPASTLPTVKDTSILVEISPDKVRE